MRARARDERCRAELREAVHPPVIGDDVVRGLRPAVPSHDERRRGRAARELVDDRALAFVAEAEAEDELDPHGSTCDAPQPGQNFASAFIAVPHAEHARPPLLTCTTGAATTGAASARELATCAIAAIAFS